MINYGMTWHHAVPCQTILYHMTYDTISSNMTWQTVIFLGHMAWYSMIRYDTSWYNILYHIIWIWYHAVLEYTRLSRDMSYYTTLYFTVPRCNALCCTILWQWYTLVHYGTLQNNILQPNTVFCNMHQSKTTLQLNIIQNNLISYNISQYHTIIESYLLWSHKAALPCITHHNIEICVTSTLHRITSYRWPRCGSSQMTVLYQ